MGLQVAIDRSGRRAIFQIRSQDNWDDFRMALREGGAKHLDKVEDENGLSRSHGWVASLAVAYVLIPRLQKIENFTVPAHIMERLAPKPETQFKRAVYKTSLLRMEPKGDYQKAGIVRGISQNRLALFWEMGTGKTPVIVSILNHLFDRGDADRVLVLCPAEGLYNFRRELLRFNTFNLKEEEIYVANVEDRDPFNPFSRVAIMTYNTLRMLSDSAYALKMKTRSTMYRNPVLPLEDWGTKRVLICDEGHKVKNPTSRTFHILKMYIDHFPFRYFLTGTPAPRGPEDLWTQIHLLDPFYAPPTFDLYVKEIAMVGNEHSSKAITGYRPEKVKEMEERFSPLVSRVLQDPATLPPLIEEVVLCRLSSAQRNLFNALVEHTLISIKEKSGGEILLREVVMKFPYISLALHNPDILKGKVTGVDPSSTYLAGQVGKWKFEMHSKLEVLDSLVEKYLDEGEKVTIWSGHPDTINSLAKRYEKLSPFYIHGDEATLPPEVKRIGKEAYRDSMVEEFKVSKTRNLLIASYLVLNTAVNLTECTRVIYFDRPWDWAVYAQSVKRFHRIGATKPVVVKSLVFMNTLEEAQNIVLEGRKALNEGLFKTKAPSAAALKGLFEGDGTLLGTT